MVDLALTEQEIDAAIRPYVTERLDSGDSRWQAIVGRVRDKQQARLHRREESAPLSAQPEVERRYTRHWSRPIDELWAPKVVPFEWRGQGLLMQSNARRRLNHLLLARALQATGATRVLEVGCGTGFHLFLLAAQRPSLQLAGVELTTSGIGAADDIRRSARLPDIIAGFSPEPIASASAHQGVRLLRATAAALPFADASFDAVCTVLALEQMEAIRAQALAELRRVTRRFVVMVEPFRDLNSEGIRLDYVRSVDYLNETIAGLRNHGLEPRAVYRDIPNKLTYHVALVIAERM